MYIPTRHEAEYDRKRLKNTSQQFLADLHAKLDRGAREEMELKRKGKREKEIERKREKSSVTFSKLKAKAAAGSEEAKQISSHL